MRRQIDGWTVAGCFIFWALGFWIGKAATPKPSPNPPVTITVHVREPSQVKPVVTALKGALPQLGEMEVRR